MSKNPKKSFQRFTVSANSQCICAFGAEKNCVVGETTCIVWVCALPYCLGQYSACVCLVYMLLGRIVGVGCVEEEEEECQKGGYRLVYVGKCKCTSCD